MTENTKIYVDIQSLIDLRQGILSQLSATDDMAEYLVSNDYNFRELDVFPLVDMVKYKEIEAASLKKTISLGTVTYIINSIKSKIVAAERRNVHAGKAEAPEIILNIHPFKLNNEELAAIQNLLFVKMGIESVITIVDIKMEELTPFLIKTTGFIACFIYDFGKWFLLHSNALMKIKLSDSTLYFPALYAVEEDKDQLKEINKIGFKDLFSYVEYLLSERIVISFLPAVFYSNIITSSLILKKFNKDLKGMSLDDVTKKEEPNVNSRNEV